MISVAAPCVVFRTTRACERVCSGTWLDGMRDRRALGLPGERVDLFMAAQRARVAGAVSHTVSGSAVVGIGGVVHGEVLGEALALLRHPYCQSADIKSIEQVLHSAA